MERAGRGRGGDPLRSPLRTGSGIDFLVEANRLHGHAKRVLLAGYGDPELWRDVTRALALGRIDSYVPKPWLSPEEGLYERMAAVLAEWGELESAAIRVGKGGGR